MKVSNLMTKKPKIIEEKATALEAIETMQNANCGILPIGPDHQHIIGVITDRDIMVRAVAKNKDIRQTPVKEIMSNNVIFCEENDSLHEAVSRMNQHHIRRILIKDKYQALSGILSLGDVIRRVEDSGLLAHLFKETTVA